MKNLFPLLCFYLLLLQSGVAQHNADLATLRLLDVEYGLKGSLRQVFPGPNGSLYALVTFKPNVAFAKTQEAIKLMKYDADLEFEAEIELPEAKYAPEFPHGGVAIFTDALGEPHVLWTEMEKDHTVIYANAATGDAPAQVARLENVNSKDFSGMQFMKSDDGSHGAIIFRTAASVEDRKESHFAVVNENMHVEDIYSLETKASVRQERFVLDNSGSILHLWVTDNEPDKKEQTYYTLNFDLLSDGRVTSSYQKEGIKEDRVSTRLAAKKGSFHCALYGSYSYEVEVRKKGKKRTKTEWRDRHQLRHIQLDDETLQPLADTTLKISNSLIEKVIAEPYLRFALKEIWIMKDTSVLVVGEAFHRSDGRFVQTSSRMIVKPPSGKYTNILLLNLDKSGEIQDKQMIDREQYSTDLWVLSFGSASIDGDRYITYMDRDKDTRFIRVQYNAGKLDIDIQVFDKKVMTKLGVDVDTVIKWGERVCAVINHRTNRAKVAIFSLK